MAERQLQAREEDQQEEEEEEEARRAEQLTDALLRQEAKKMAKQGYWPKVGSLEGTRRWHPAWPLLSRAVCNLVGSSTSQPAQVLPCSSSLVFLPSRLVGNLDACRSPCLGLRQPWRRLNALGLGCWAACHLALFGTRSHLRALARHGRGEGAAVLGPSCPDGPGRTGAWFPFLSAPLVAPPLSGPLWSSLVLSASVCPCP